MRLSARFASYGRPPFTPATALVLLAAATSAQDLSLGANFGRLTRAGETRTLGELELFFSTEIARFERLGRAEVEAIALESGAFDTFESRLVTSFAVAYAQNDDLEYQAQLGYVTNDNLLAARSIGAGVVATEELDADGFGDLWLDAKYRVLHGNFGHLSLLGGVKVPLGQDDIELSNGALLGPKGQPTSGAFDVRAGIAATHALSERWKLDASSLYTLRGDTDEIKIGDRVELGVACTWIASKLPTDLPSLGFSLEAYGTWSGDDEVQDATDEHSGGKIVYIAPGARLRFDGRFSLACLSAFPLWQDWNGDQAEERWRAMVGISIEL